MDNSNAAAQEYTNNQLKVLIYHNSNSKLKHLTKRDLQNYDVIMISCMRSLLQLRVSRSQIIDSGLESIYRKEWKGWNRNDGIVKEDSK